MNVKFLDKWFRKAGAQEKEAAQLHEEAKTFQMPGEGIPVVLKYAFFIGLAFLNFHLFQKAVPGGWGIGIGIAAILSEILILYASHNFSRASGAFRYSLAGFGGLLMLFSIVHAGFSVADLMSGGEPSAIFVEY